MATLGMDLEPTYENFYATCPYCGYKNVFNRVSDLKTVSLISYKSVQCLNCHNEFGLNSDILNPPFEYFLWDAEKCKRDKHYMHCILNIAQAYEMFFSLYLLIDVVNEPYYSACAVAKDNFEQKEALHEQVNEVLGLFYETIKKYTFSQLRNLFIWRVIASENAPVQSLYTSEQIIQKFSQCACKNPTNERIQCIVNAKLSKILQQLKDCKIGSIRNKVVHKYAYRPSLSEAEECLDDAQKTLSQLRIMLKFDKKYHHLPPKVG